MDGRCRRRGGVDKRDMQVTKKRSWQTGFYGTRTSGRCTSLMYHASWRDLADDDVTFCGSSRSVRATSTMEKQPGHRRSCGPVGVAPSRSAGVATYGWGSALRLPHRTDGGVSGRSSCTCAALVARAGTWATAIRSAVLSVAGGAQRPTSGTPPPGCRWRRAVEPADDGTASPRPPWQIPAGIWSKPSIARRSATRRGPRTLSSTSLIPTMRHIANDEIRGDEQGVHVHDGGARNLWYFACGARHRPGARTISAAEDGVFRVRTASRPKRYAREQRRGYAAQSYARAINGC